MNREEILERSRRENRNRDYYEEELAKQGGTIVGGSMVLLATAFCVIQFLMGGGINYGLYAIVCCRSMVLAWMRWVRSKQDQQLSLALLCTVGVLLLSAGYIYELATASAA